MPGLSARVQFYSLIRNMGLQSGKLRRGPCNTKPPTGPYTPQRGPKEAPIVPHGAQRSQGPPKHEDHINAVDIRNVPGPNLKVCKIMAFLATYSNLGLLFYTLLGSR